MAFNGFLEGLVLSASAVQMLKDSDEQRGMELHIVELMDEHGAPMDPEAFIVTALPPDEVLSTPDPKRVNSMMSQSCNSQCKAKRSRVSGVRSACTDMVGGCQP